MDAGLSLPIESSPQSDLGASFRPHGDSAPTEHCGHLRDYAHALPDGRHHVRRGIATCKRWECSTCWKAKGGALDREMERIVDGVLPDGGALTEILVAPNCDQGMLRDAWYRNDVIRRVRAAYKLKGPWAWVYHDRLDYANGYPDGCPHDSVGHLHLFGQGPAMLHEHHRLAALRCEVKHKPGLRESLEVTLRVCLSPGLNSRRKWVPWIGWFGRRAPPHKPRDPLTGKPPRVEKSRYCPLCRSEVALRDFRMVVSVAGPPPEEGWFEAGKVQAYQRREEWGARR